MKLLRDWDDLPDFMRTEEVRPYYDVLKKHEKELYLKRAFDLVAASFLLIILAPIMLIVAIWIKLDSPGPVLFRQTRITQYGKEFIIYKFRTMVNNADKMGAAVTIGDDSRITKVGAIIRKYRIDEFPQLINIFLGDMSFVGTRPETKSFVDCYIPVYYATFLLAAGVTSEASIRYKDESDLLIGIKDVDSYYLESILPKKMEWNLKSIENFSLINDFHLIIRTVLAITGLV